jgi:hypothetical protein
MPDTHWDDWDIKRRAMDRERKRLASEREQRMAGDHAFPHVRAAIHKRMVQARLAKGKK